MFSGTGGCSACFITAPLSSKPYIYIYVFIVFIYIYVYVYLYLYLYFLYVYIYIHIYIYIYISALEPLTFKPKLQEMVRCDVVTFGSLAPGPAKGRDVLFQAVRVFWGGLGFRI